MTINTALENIYISPLESCNLNCRLCYTHKTKNILSNSQILSFVKRYHKYLKNFSLFQREISAGQKGLFLKSILFCGGEVFTLKNFPLLVNKLISQNIFITIITNGTIDRLKSIKTPANCQLLVSLDGPKEIHDLNRGSGNYDKTIKFIRHALALNFPIEIMYLVTPQSYPFIDSLPQTLSQNLQLQSSKAPTLQHSNTPKFQSSKVLKFSYVTQKTYFYTANHPLARRNHGEGGPLSKPALTPAQIINLKQNYPSVPSGNFGCFQLSLQSNGQIYGCCESPYPLAKISDPIKKMVESFVESLEPCFKCQISPVIARPKAVAISS